MAVHDVREVRRSWKKLLWSVSWRMGAAAAGAAIVVCSLQRFQTARVAKARAEEREHKIGTLIDLYSQATDWSRPEDNGLWAAVCAYLSKSLSAGLQRLQTKPDIEHPWLASAMIYKQVDDSTALVYAVVDQLVHTDDLVIMDGDQVIGAYRCERNSSMRRTHSPLNGLAVIKWVDTLDARQTPIDPYPNSVNTLPRSVLTHSLRLKVSKPDSQAIEIFVDPLLLPHLSPTPALFRQILP